MNALRVRSKPGKRAAAAVFASTLFASACSSPTAPPAVTPPPALTSPTATAPALPSPSMPSSAPAESKRGGLVAAPAAKAGAVRDAFANRNLVGHLEALQRIADEEGGNRASGTPGYEASSRYVEEQLRSAGYTPVRQVFTYWDKDLEADRETFNILADTAGSAEHTVVIGGHLDSVPEGPGINDNASGVAAIIETARWMAETGVKPANRVRFAFWGGEEIDLLGSEHYVDSLSEREKSQTALNINLDMVASPNGGRFVHDGDGSSFGDAGPEGSDEIERLFLDYFARNSLPAEATVFDQGSDYEPFLEAGIAVGGLFSGDVGTKTAEQVRDFGGIEDEDHDPCYHESCDTLENVNQDLLKEMAGALGYATLAFAMTPQIDR